MPPPALQAIPFALVPTTGFEIALYPPGATFGPRNLGTYEFVWMIEGDAQYRCEGVTAEAPQRSVVLCRPESRDFFRWDPNRRTRHAYFHFLLQGSCPAEWPAPENWPFVRLPLHDSDLLPLLFQHLLSADRDATHMQITLAMLLAAFVTGHTIPSADPRGGSVDIAESAPEPVRRALRHVLDRLEDNGAATITLDEMAEAACVTREYLCRLFKSSTGRSPLATVRRIRLDRSRKLLERTNYSVGETAALNGFENPFHFSRAFKAQFGQSPRTLRDFKNKDS